MPGPEENAPHSGRGRVTIRDVARYAGVSIGTVSLALAGNTSVAESTRQRVRDAARALHYSPSAVGRALQARRTGAVGLVVPHSSGHVFGHIYFMEVLAGVTEVLNQANMTLVLSTAPTESDEEAAYVKILKTQQVDGIILASAALDDKNIASLALGNDPFVFIGRYPLDPCVPSVGVDDLGGARLAVQHLIEHGHTRIAHISGPVRHLSAMDRSAGYRQALQKAGIEVRSELCYEGDYSEQSGRTAMRTLLELEEPPTALFAASDETAIGVMAELRAAGIEPGEFFPVVGFDDVLLARLVTPALTTIRQPMRRLGSEAAQKVMSLISGRPPDTLQIELPTELVVRASCGCRPSE